MHNAQPNVFTRDDTFFGVCEALGEDFGFHPNFLRVALAVLLFFNPVAVIVGYPVLGVAVALSRWLFPKPAFADAAAGTPAAGQAARAGDNDAVPEELAAAA